MHSRLSHTHHLKIGLSTSLAVLALYSSSAIAQEQSPQMTPLPSVTVVAPQKKKATTAKPKTMQDSASGSQAASQPMVQAETAPAGASTTEIQKADGSIAAGYRVETVSTIGPFSDMRLQDTPYSFTVLSNEFLQNTQSQFTPGAFAEKLPSVQFNYSDQRPITGVGSFRGIGFSSNQQLIDGLPVPTTSSLLFLEPFDRIEVMSGVSGFMYGVGSSAGMFNYVLKRPTVQPMASVTVGMPHGTDLYSHADVGGTLAGGGFGYRFNVVGQTGDTDVDDQSFEKGLVSSALDFRPTDGVLIQVDASYSHYYQDQLPPTWAAEAGRQRLPDPPDPKRDWGQPWTYADVDTVTLGTNVKVDLTDNITSRSSLRFIHTEYDSIFINNFVRPDDTFRQRANFNKDNGRENLSGYQFFDFKFDTFSIDHKLTVGYYASRYTESNARDYLSRTFLPDFHPLGTPPAFVTNPDLTVGTLPRYTLSEIESSNWTIGDQIDFNRYWSAIVGVSHSSIDTSSWNVAGDLTDSYSASATTPTYALIFKPADFLTTYASFAQGLQQGTVVTGPQFTNVGEVLPPYVRDQYEVGVKATVRNVFLTLALFDIESDLQYTVDNGDGTLTIKQDGRQDNRGIEFTVTGEVLPGLRILGGFTSLDVKVKKNEANPALVGKRVQGIADNLIKVTAEYDIPLVEGLTITGGVYTTTDFYGDALNTDLLSGRTTFDLGFRYATEIRDQPIVLRFDVRNLTDERYWLGLGAGNTLGDARRFMGSVQMAF